MGKNTEIAWCDHTFNPWRGCTKVSPGCDKCYAEAMSRRNPRLLGVWGDDGTRVIASDSYWREPLRWDREAAAAGKRARVFCASLADVFEDRDELRAPRTRLFQLVEATPHLDWLLLTKRPENADKLWSIAWRDAGTAHDYGARAPWLPNIWLGTTCEDQKRAEERIPHLLATPAAVRFLSCEPLLGPVDLRPFMRWVFHAGVAPNADGSPFALPAVGGSRGVDWVIVGGESGAGARAFDIRWARSIVDECRNAGVPVFVKQMGARPLARSVYDMSDNDYRAWDSEHAGEPFPVGGVPLRLRDKKGGDMAEWPEDLRVREVPGVYA